MNEPCEDGMMPFKLLSGGERSDSFDMKTVGPKAVSG